MVKSKWIHASKRLDFAKSNTCKRLCSKKKKTHVNGYLMRLKGTKWSDPQLSEIINMKFLGSCMKCYIRYIHPQVVEFNLSRAFLYQNINKACIKSFLVSKYYAYWSSCKHTKTNLHTYIKKEETKRCVCERERTCKAISKVWLGIVRSFLWPVRRNSLFLCEMISGWALERAGLTRS